jgi:hypothetical protein
MNWYIDWVTNHPLWSAALGLIMGLTSARAAY